MTISKIVQENKYFLQTDTYYYKITKMEARGRIFIGVGINNNV